MKYSVESIITNQDIDAYWVKHPEYSFRLDVANALLAKAKERALSELANMLLQDSVIRIEEDIKCGTSVGPQKFIVSIEIPH